jgi:hypothetical protein
MRPKLIIICLILFCTAVQAQTNSNWEKWTWLMGEWKGEGAGKPGQGEGTFSFKQDLDGKVLVRKSHAEYPAAGSRPATKHDDLMIVYADQTGAPVKAIYFDNEGHTINYSIAYSDKSIVLTSEKIPGVPQFRLSYALLEDKAVNTKFEMSQDGEHYITYVEGKSKRVN